MKKKQKRNKKSKTISPHPATRTPACAKPELRYGEGRDQPATMANIDQKSIMDANFIETNYYSPAFDASEEMSGYQLAEPTEVKRQKSNGKNATKK